MHFVELPATAGPEEVFAALKALFPEEINLADLWNILKGVEGLCAIPSQELNKISAWQQEIDREFLHEEDGAS